MQDATSSSAPRRFSFDKAATWAIVLSVAIAALAMFFPFAPLVTIPFLFTKVSILAVGVLIALALFILARLTRGNVVIPPPLLLGALWFVPLAYALSMLFSGVSISSAFFGREFESDTFGFMLLLALLASLTALTLRRGKEYRMLFRTLAVALGITLVAQIIFLVVGRMAPSLVSPTTNLIGTFPDLGMVAGLGVVVSLIALRLLALPSRSRTFIYIGGAVGLAVITLVNSPLIWTLVALVAMALFIEAIMRHRGAGADEGDLDGVVVANDGGKPTEISMAWRSCLLIPTAKCAVPSRARSLRRL